MKKTQVPNGIKGAIIWTIVILLFLPMAMMTYGIILSFLPGTAH